MGIYPRSEDLISELGLLVHPEGGFFRETFRDSGGKIQQCSLPATFSGDRDFSTAILFMVLKGNASNLHRMAAAEVWHFYFGRPLTVVEIDEGGNLKETVLGHDHAAGQKSQYVVPAGVWFGAYCSQDTAAGPESQLSPLSTLQEVCDYSYVGCTVAPAFEFEDFELASRVDLLSKFPQHEATIVRLTRET